MHLVRLQGRQALQKGFNASFVAESWVLRSIWCLPNCAGESWRLSGMNALAVCRADKPVRRKPCQLQTATAVRPSRL